MAALPRRGDNGKISCRVQASLRSRTRFPLHSQNVSLNLMLENKEFTCRVQNVIAKHNLFSAVLARRFVYPDANENRETCCEQSIERKCCMLLLCTQNVPDGYKAAFRVQNMVAIKLRNTSAIKITCAGPGHGGGTPPARTGLPVRGKAGNNRSGKACFSPAVFPAFLGALGPSYYRVPKVTAAHCLK